MKLGVVWIVGIAVLIACQFSMIDAKPERVPKDLDLATPFTNMSVALQKFLANFNLEKTISTLLWFVVECVLGLGAVDPPERLMAWNQIQDKLMNYTIDHQKEIEDAVIALSFEDICNAPIFALIHKQVWVDDEHKSLNDLVGFFNRFGYPNIYIVLRLLYMTNNCPNELTNSLPSGPNPPKNVTGDLPLYKRSLDIRDQFLRQQSDTSLAQQLPELKCDLLEIITRFLETGLLDLVAFINTVIHEVIQKPSIHFLFGKVQEPAKGKSFQEFRLMPQIRHLLYEVNKVIMDILKGLNLIELIKDLIGLDLGNTNIIELLLTLFEGIFWFGGHFEITPPYIPPTAQVF